MHAGIVLGDGFSSYLALEFFLQQPQVGKSFSAQRLHSSPSCYAYVPDTGVVLPRGFEQWTVATVFPTGEAEERFYTQRDATVSACCWIGELIDYYLNN